jgi:hypothetical protein
LYSVVEASRLLKTPRRTLARWVEGYVLTLRSGERSYAPLLAKNDAREFLTFGDLVELMYVRRFREAGVPLEELRSASSKFRQEWGLDYPLATKRFAMFGKKLLLEKGGVWQHALTGQQSLFFDQVGARLIHTGDLTSEWRPLGRARAVVLNPDRAFGKPIDDTSGAHTYILSQALSKEHDAAKVAWWYGTTTSAVEDAAEFEKSLSGRTTHGDVLL